MSFWENGYYQYSPPPGYNPLYDGISSQILNTANNVGVQTNYYNQVQQAANDAYTSYAQDLALGLGSPGVGSDGSAIDRYFDKQEVYSTYKDALQTIRNEEMLAGALGIPWGSSIPSAIGAISAVGDKVTGRNWSYSDDSFDIITRSDTAIDGSAQFDAHVLEHIDNSRPAVDIDAVFNEADRQISALNAAHADANPSFWSDPLGYIGDGIASYFGFNETVKMDAGGNITADHEFDILNAPAIGMALGMIPGAGPFLSAAYTVNRYLQGNDEFNVLATLLGKSEAAPIGGLMKVADWASEKLFDYDLSKEASGWFNSVAYSTSDPYKAPGLTPEQEANLGFSQYYQIPQFTNPQTAQSSGTSYVDLFDDRYSQIDAIRDAVPAATEEDEVEFKPFELTPVSFDDLWKGGLFNFAYKNMPDFQRLNKNFGKQMELPNITLEDIGLLADRKEDNNRHNRTNAFSFG